MTKQLTFPADLTLIEGTIDGPRGLSKICIPIRSIKLFMEGRNPKTNEQITAIVLHDTAYEVALIETIEEVKKQYEGKLNALLLNT